MTGLAVLSTLTVLLPTAVFGYTYNYGDGSYYVGEFDDFGLPSGVGKFYNTTGKLGKKMKPCAVWSRCVITMCRYHAAPTHHHASHICTLGKNFFGTAQWARLFSAVGKMAKNAGKLAKDAGKFGLCDTLIKPIIKAKN